PARLVDVDADEVEGRGDGPKLVVGEHRSLAARLGEVLVRVPPLEHHGHEAGVPLTRRLLRRLDVCRRVDDGTATRMFSARPTLVPAGPRARIACTARPCPRTA